MFIREVEFFVLCLYYVIYKLRRKITIKIIWNLEGHIQTKRINRISKMYLRLYIVVDTTN